MRCGLVAFLLMTILAAKGTGQAREPEKTNVGNAAAEDHAEPAKLAQEAIDRLKSDGIAGFMGVAFSGRKGFLRQVDRAKAEAAFVTLHDFIVANHGKPLGEVDLVRTENVGSSVVRLTYVEKLERGIIVWYLDFYRNESEWRWTGLNAKNDKLNADFQPVRQNATFKDAATLAQHGIDGLKSNGVPKLLDAVFAAGKTVVNGARAQAELSVTSFYEKSVAPLGKPLGEFELLRAESIGESLVRFVYLQKFTEGVIVWKFSFYCASGEWKWQDLNLGEWGSVFVDK
jgi:hypothetical protein